MRENRICRLLRAWALLLVLAALSCACGRAAPAVSAPPRLADTGLYADFASRRLAAAVLPFTPQYPLWTDGALKQRWIALPAGARIDASDVDHWRFPIGTRLWKQFSFGRAVETRFMQLRADGSWLYATYQWNRDGSDAVLAPAGGVRAVCASSAGQHHDLPAVADCRLCHEGGRTAVLGFSALQLSPDRDPLAPHATPHGAGDVDLPGLVARGLLDHLDPRWLQVPPRIGAPGARQRAALGYLHGNCSSCHNADGPLQRLGLRLDYPLANSGAPPALASTVGVASHFTRGDALHRVLPGAPERSTLLLRLGATDPLAQMPPFGRHLADADAIDLLADWVRSDLAATTIPTDLEPNQPRRR